MKTFPLQSLTIIERSKSSLRWWIAFVAISPAASFLLAVI